MAVRFDAETDGLSSSLGIPASGSPLTITGWAYLEVDRDNYSTHWALDASGGAGQYVSTQSNGVSIMAYDTDGGAGTVDPLVPHVVGQWRRVALVVNGTNATVYAGQPTGALSAVSTTSWNAGGAPTAFHLGRHPEFAGEWLNGRLAAVKMWTAALTQAEVEAELAQYAPVRRANLNRYYPLTNSTQDFSGNGYHLTAGSTAVTWVAGPPTIARVNTFEGGTSGATITTGNSGGASGDAFELAPIGANATAVYSSAQAMHGTRSALVTISSAGTANNVQLLYTLLSGEKKVAARGYFRFTSFPTASQVIMAVGDVGGSYAFKLYVQTDGTVFVQDLGNTTKYTSTTKLALNRWYRFDVVVNQGTTTSNGAIVFVAYVGDSPIGAGITGMSYVGLAENTGTGGLTNVQFGKPTSGDTVASTFYMDSVAIQEGSDYQIGPPLNSLPIVGNAVSSGNNVTTATVTWPSGVKAGDIALLSWSRLNTTVATIPAGFTVLGTPVTNVSLTSMLLRRVCDGTESGTTLNLTTDATNRHSAVLTVVRGKDVANFASRVEGTSGTTHANPALTAPDSDPSVLTFFAERGAGSTDVVPGAGYGNLANTKLAANGAGGTITAVAIETPLTSRASWSSVTPPDWTSGNAFSTATVVTWTVLLGVTSPKIETLTDNFATADGAKWGGYDANTYVANGQLVQEVRSDYWAGLRSQISYNLTGSSAHARLVQRPNVGNGSTEAMFRLGPDDSNYVAWYVTGNRLYAEHSVAGTRTDIFFLPYDPALHQRLRIRESGGTIFFDTYDGSTWTQRGSWAHTFALAAVRPFFLAGWWDAETTPGTAIWDDFNIAPTRLPIQLLLNPGYEDSNFDSVWNYWEATITRDTATKRTGTASAKVVTTANTGHEQGIVQFGDTGVQRAGTKVVCSAWFLGTAGETFYIEGRANDANWDYLSEGQGSVSFTATGAWQQVSTTAWDATGVIPGLQIVQQTPQATSKTFWVDDASVVATFPAKKWVNCSIVQLPRDGNASSTVNFTPATAGNLLVVVIEGAVTHTVPTGWTRHARALNQTDLWMAAKTATAGESSFTTDHNGSNYPIVAVVYEFPAGSTTGTGVEASGLAHNAPNPTLSGLTGVNLLFGAVAETLPTTIDAGTVSTAWSGVTGLVEDVDVFDAGYGQATDGYLLSIACVEDSTATSFAPTGTVTASTGQSLISKEAITFAVKVSGTGTNLLRLGASAPSKLYVGGTQVTKAYLGSTLVVG